MQNHIDENKIIRLINAIDRYMHPFRFKILEIVKFPVTRYRENGTRIVFKHRILNLR